MATYAEQLTTVQDAIAAIETKGQSYTILNRTYTRADLKTLYDREAFLRRQIARESRGGIRQRVIVPVDS